MGTLRLLVLAALIALAPPGEKRREHYPDGTLKLEYVVNSNEQKHGYFREFWPDGAKKIKTTYKLDLLDGRYESWHQEGSPHVVAKYSKGEPEGAWNESWPGEIPKLEASYRKGVRQNWFREWDRGGDLRLEEEYLDGLRHGARRLIAGGEVLSEQIWESGALVGLWGSRRLYPQPLGPLRDALEAFAAEAEAARPKRPRMRDEPEDRDFLHAQTLARLKAYRLVAGIGVDGMALDEFACTQAQAAAELIARIGRIVNTPENPGMPEADFATASAALEHCLIAQGWTWPEALDAWMHPPAEGGLAARRLLLQPRYRLAGLGSAEPFAAFWTLDASGPPFAGSAVFLPANGWMPVELFRKDSAWTFELSPRHWSMPDPKELKLKVWAMDDDFIRSSEALELDLVQVDHFQVAFRPTGFRPVAGYRYWVRAEGLRDHEGELAELAYLVHFTTREAPLIRDQDAD